MERIGSHLEVQSHHDILHDRELLVEPDVLECPCDSEAAYLPCRKARYIISIEYDPACGRLIDTGYLVEKRCLASTVRTDESRDESLLDMEIDIIDRDDASELTLKVLSFKNPHALPPFAFFFGRTKKSWSFSILVRGSP